MHVCTRLVKMSGELLLRERKTLIQERLKANGRVLAVDLAAELNVSEDTIRRDLREMAAAGLCERVYGGALPVVPAAHSTLRERVAMAPERKAALACAAAGLIKPGMTVFLDAGSTNLAIAQLIEPDLQVTVVTNTPLIAAALMEKPGWISSCSADRSTGQLGRRSVRGRNAMRNCSGPTSAISAPAAPMLSPA